MRNRVKKIDSSVVIMLGIAAFIALVVILFLLQRAKPMKEDIQNPKATKQKTEKFHDDKSTQKETAGRKETAEDFSIIDRDPNRKEVIYQAKERISIPTKKTLQKRTLELPSFKKEKDRILCLRFHACIYYPKPGGWNPYLGIILNNKNLEKYTITGEERLLRRGFFCETTIESKKEWWGKREGIPVLLTFFGPGGDVLDERIIKPREEGYWYLLDISDLANYMETGADDRVESAEPNTLTFINTLITRYLRGERTTYPDMRIDNLTIEYIPKSLVAKLRPAIISGKYEDLEGASIKGKNFFLIISKSGGMQLKIGSDSYFFTSIFSYPGEKINYNTFSPEESKGETLWKPDIVKVSNKIITARAEGDNYQLLRTISVLKEKINIKDTIINKKVSPIGLVIKNSIATEKLPKPRTYFLAGVDDKDMLICGVAANPTLFITQEQSSLGMVAEDNVFRLQLELMREGNTFNFSTTHFGLDREKDYTLEWSIYPSLDKEYFAFINKVRRDWDVNFTIEGPFVFDGSRRSGRKAKIYVFGPWLDYFDEAGLTRTSYKKSVEKTLARLKSAQQDGIFMPKTETNLVTIDKRKIQGGEILPTSHKSVKGGTYGLVLTKEQSKVLSGTVWDDSLLRTADNRIIVDTYYPGDPYINFLLYLEEGNYRYNHFMNQIDFCMDELGFNGIYIDQFSQEGSLSRMDRCTYEKWDGHTVDIDKSGRIKRRYTDCNLVGAATRAKILKYILSKGGKVVINGHATVRETQSLPAFRFAEMENESINPLSYLHDKPPVFYWQARGHLSSPIILGIRPHRLGEEGRKRYSEVIIKAVITALRNGLLYYYYSSTIPSSDSGAGEYGPINHMFPFTPKELHAGWLVGEERIITCVSGTYQWYRSEKPMCHLFDLRGREKENTFKITGKGKGYEVKVNIDDWNEIAIIEQ